MLKIFNTWSRTKEIFISNSENIVNLYICGITVSDNCHIGHARTYCFFDILVRYLKYLGKNCVYVRNITDIDDKIIKYSLLNKMNIKNYTNKYISNINYDFHNLNILSPTYEPKVTDYISQIILLITKLLSIQVAYIGHNGDVLFSMKKALKDINLNSIFNRRRIKSNNSDFVLWKLNMSTDIYSVGWHAPWGYGRPGWHIECVVLSSVFFSRYIDIHGGGIDLLYPHHENELLIFNYLFYHDRYIKYWMHTGLVILSKNKVSKFNKRFYLRYLLNYYNSEIIKFYLMSTHYRKHLFFDYHILENYKCILTRMYLSLKGLDLSIIINNKDKILFKDYEDEYFRCMNNDFDIPKIYELFFDMYHQINKWYNKKYNLASKLGKKLLQLANIIGLMTTNINDFLYKQIKNKKKCISLRKIQRLMKIRQLARLKKDWNKADFIKQQLWNWNIRINDYEDSSEWYFS